jgi:hypothetical protein
MRALALIVCLALPLTAVAQDEFWCWDADEIVAEVCGDTVHLFHHAALLNCCPDPITHEGVVGDATIFVVEHSQSPCDCDCCYNVHVTLDDVPAGPWNVLYRWFDIEIWDWTERVLQIVVPDLGQGYEPYVAREASSGCLDSSDVPESSEAAVSWGVIKTLYQ